MFADGDPSSLIAIPKMRTCWNLLHFLSGTYSDVGQQALSWKLKMLDIWPNCASACTVVGTGVMLLNPECFLQTSHTITFFHSARSPTLNSLPPGINVCISLMLSTASHEVSLKFFLILTKHEEENTFCTFWVSSKTRLAKTCKNKSFCMFWVGEKRWKNIWKSFCMFWIGAKTLKHLKKTFCTFWVSAITRLAKTCKKFEKAFACFRSVEKTWKKHLKKLFWVGAKRCRASRLAQLAQLVRRQKLLQVFDFPV